jgi:hypothetical protein
MLKPYATEARGFTLIYRGYDLEVTRSPSGWFVGVYPNPSPSKRGGRIGSSSLRQAHV